MSQETDPSIPNTEFKTLYKFGGAAAWVVAFLTVAEIIAFVIFPPPTTISEWFSLYQTNPLIGLVDFWGLELPMYLMFVIVFLALYIVLRDMDRSWMLISLVFALIGITIFLATNNPFSMFTLSHQYSAATTEAQRSALMAAGEALLANTNQRAVGGFNLGLFLVNITGLIVSIVMFKAPTFGKSIAYLGILAWGLSLADYLRQAFTESVVIALFVIIPGALLLVIWFIVLGRKLWRLGLS